MAESQNSPDGLEINIQGRVPNKLPGNKSSSRFQGAMWANSELIAQRPEVVGLENLEKIPEGINPIIAGSHLRTDASLQIIARELDKEFDIGMAVQAGNRRYPPTNFAFAVIGQDNFYDVDDMPAKKKTGINDRGDRYNVNFNDYDAMKEAMRKGKTMLIAAHYAPVYNGILPNKPGFAAIYLAHLSGQRVVLPVALDVYTDDPDTGRVDRMSKIAKNLLTRNRPKSKMTICEPITFDPIDPFTIELMRKWLTERLSDEPVDLKPEEREKAVETFKKMRKDGEKVMHALANVLPLERRGVWDRKPVGE